MKPPCCFILPKTVVTGIAAAALAAANVRAAEAPNCEENPGAASCAAPWAATGQDDACKDTPGWANGVTGCSDRGFKEADGCSVKGWTCAKYRQSWCADGKAMKGMEFAIGEDFNSPEINCCSCGGGKRRPAAGHDQIDVGKASSERVELQSFPKCEQSAPAAFSNCDHFGGELAGHTLRSCEDMSKLLGGNTFNFGASGSSHPGLCLIKKCRAGNLMYETNAAFPGPWEVYSTAPCHLATDNQNAVQNLVPPVKQAATDERSAAQQSSSSGEQAYYVDNSALKSRARGIEYRLSKAMAHRAGFSHYAAYGSKVTGVDEGDGWLRVGTSYLPMDVRTINVLLKQSAHPEHAGAPAAAAAPTCEDTAKWTNGFEQCAENGYTVEQGCVKDVGFSCWAYEMMSYCKHGKALAGMEWSQGEGFSFPEKNCCVCGGGKVSKAASA